MDVFKKLTVVRRRNSRSGSIVSDDDDADFCYHESGAVMIEKSKDLGAGSSTPSLYGRRNTERPADSSCPPKMAVVTSSKFDSDETFSSVAQAIINQYQNENMSEREAIRCAINNPDDLVAFIEALDLRYIVFASQNTDGMESSGDDTLSEIVIKTRTIFDTSLKAMWREHEALSSHTGMIGQEGDFREHLEEMITLDDEYNKHHPKTPKNLRMSPMRTSSFNYRNHGFISQSESIDSACTEGSNGSMFRPFKRPRRWFFPQNKSESLAAPLFLSASAKIVAEKNSGTMKPILPKFHFKFGKNNHLDNIAAKKNSMMFGDINRGPTAVQSLQLDGTSASYGSLGNGSGPESTYVPPTSPIRNVSLEMGMSGNTAAAMG